MAKHTDDLEQRLSSWKHLAIELSDRVMNLEQEQRFSGELVRLAQRVVNESYLKTDGTIPEIDELSSLLKLIRTSQPRPPIGLIGCGSCI